MKCLKLAYNMCKSVAAKRVHGRAVYWAQSRICFRCVSDVSGYHYPYEYASQSKRNMGFEFSYTKINQEKTSLKCLIKSPG